MEWYRQVQFIAAVPMPPEMAEEYGTTVNGMWASPEFGDSYVVTEQHREGRRVLFSVPLIALVPQVYEEPGAEYLLDEVCRDIHGAPSECDWYYWETKPVFAACIYSGVFRGYLLDRCKGGVDRGMDVVNLDEIMTSVGLMDRDPGGTGFCARCLNRFRSHVRDGGDAELAATGDDDLRHALRTDDDLYERYRRFHEREAFHVMVGFMIELRAYADSKAPAFAISANVAYLGNMVPAFGTLWGPLWGPHVDFVLMENDYRIEHGEPHVLVPRGKFAAWYKLGASFKGTPTWICPSINVPRQLAGEDHRRYYELMFLEAYANGGRWGYYWWPGVDEETRRQATAPDAIKERIRFIDEHRDLFEQVTSMNDLAILYLDGPIMHRPESHEKYLALAQALAELGYQFDVRYAGDGEFNPEDLDRAALRYLAVLVPEAKDLGATSTATLEAYARSGGEVVVFSESPLDPALIRREDGQVLANFWRDYQDEDRERIATTVERFASSRIRTSDPSVLPVRYVLEGRQVLHLLNYRYRADIDRVEPVADLQVRIPWAGSTPSCTLVHPEGERPLPCRVEGDELMLDLPELELYALIVIAGGEP